MAGLNKVQLIGNLGSDPEDFETNNGGYGCNFSLATNRRWKDRDGKTQEETDWHKITCWETLAELAMDYLHTGRAVYVEGRIRYEEWEDEDGNRRFSTKIIASDIQFLDAPEDGGSRGGRSGGGRSGGRGRRDRDEDRGSRGRGRGRRGRDEGDDGEDEDRGGRRGRRGGRRGRRGGRSGGRGRGRGRNDDFDDDDIPF